MIILEEFISLPEGKTICGRISIDSAETFEKVKLPHRKHDYLDCDKENFCENCFIKPKKNNFNCNMERAIISCLDLVSRKRHIMLKNNLLAKEFRRFYGMLKNKKPKTFVGNFEAAKEVLTTAEKSND